MATLLLEGACPSLCYWWESGLCAVAFLQDSGGFCGDGMGLPCDKMVLMLCQGLVSEGSLGAAEAGPSGRRQWCLFLLGVGLNLNPSQCVA